MSVNSQVHDYFVHCIEKCTSEWNWNDYSWYDAYSGLSRCYCPSKKTWKVNEAGGRLLHPHDYKRINIEMVR